MLGFVWGVAAALAAPAPPARSPPPRASPIALPARVNASSAQVVRHQPGVPILIDVLLATSSAPGASRAPANTANPRPRAALRAGPRRSYFDATLTPAANDAATSSPIWSHCTIVVAASTSALHAESATLGQPAPQHGGEQDDAGDRHRERAGHARAEHGRHGVHQSATERGGGQRDRPGQRDVFGDAPAHRGDPLSRAGALTAAEITCVMDSG